LHPHQPSTHIPPIHLSTSAMSNEADAAWPRE
jgi:hypothetical protein